MKKYLALALLLVACRDPKYDNYNQVCTDPYGRDGESDALNQSAPEWFAIVLSPAFTEAEKQAANDACESWSEATRGAVNCWAYVDDDWAPDQDAVIAHKCPRPLKYIGSDVATYPSNFALPEVVFALDPPAIIDRKVWQHELCHVLGLPDYYGPEPSACVNVYLKMADTPTDRDLKEFWRLWD